MSVGKGGGIERRRRAEKDLVQGLDGAHTLERIGLACYTVPQLVTLRETGLDRPVRVCSLDDSFVAASIACVNADILAKSFHDQRNEFCGTFWPAEVGEGVVSGF